MERKKRSKGAEMEEEGTPPSKRVRLTKDNLKDMSREELLEKCQEQEAYIDAIMSNKRSSGTAEELVSLRESEEKLKQQQQEATQRENMLVMRLSAKEQELQDYVTQIHELKQSHNPTAAKLRNMLLDPAVNLMFERMKKEVESCKEKLEQAQNDLAAWKFTPDSQTGKRLMAKCRMLLTENEELGKVISSGRTAKLEGEIALEKKFVEEMKISQAEMDEFLEDMDEDVEGMQTTICLLQQQLKDTKDLVSTLQEENVKMCTLVANQQQPAQQPQHYGSQQQAAPQQPQHYGSQQQAAPQQPQHYGSHQQAAPQQPQHYDRVQTTGSSSSVDRTTDAAPTTPHEAAARTTHAADGYSAEMAVDSQSEHVPMDSDDACVGTQPTPPPTLHIKIELQPTSPVAHRSSFETQLADTRNGCRTTDELDNRTKEELVECPTTNGQTPTDLSQLDERSPCRADDTEHRLHDDDIADDPRRNSRSPDYDTDGSDISSDAWSPRSPPPPPMSTHHKLTKQLHGDTAMSDDDDVASPDRRSLQTDANSGGTHDVVLNGIAGVLTMKEEPNT